MRRSIVSTLDALLQLKLLNWSLPLTTDGVVLPASLFGSVLLTRSRFGNRVSLVGPKVRLLLTGIHQLSA